MREKHEDTSAASVFGKYFYDTRHRKYIARKKKKRERHTKKSDNFKETGKREK